MSIENKWKAFKNILKFFPTSYNCRSDKSYYSHFHSMIDYYISFFDTIIIEQRNGAYSGYPQSRRYYQESQAKIENNLETPKSVQQMVEKEMITQSWEIYTELDKLMYGFALAAQMNFPCIRNSDINYVPEINNR